MPIRPTPGVDSTVNLTLRIQHLMSVNMNPTPQFASISHIADKPCQEAKDWTDLESKLFLVIKVVPGKLARQNVVPWSSLYACCFLLSTRVMCLPLLSKSLSLVYVHPLNILVNGLSTLQRTLWGCCDSLYEWDFRLRIARMYCGNLTARLLFVQSGNTAGLCDPSSSLFGTRKELVTGRAMT